MSRPRSLDLPPGTEATRLETARVDLAALVARPVSGPARGHPALLVPGFTGSKEDFLGVLDGLAASGRRIVAIDQRGQYQSPGSDDPAAYALDELAQDVLAACAAIGGRVHLVGHSFGGFVARTAAALDSTRTMITSLSLMGSGPGRVTGLQTLSDLALLTGALAAQDMESIWQAKRQLERDLGEPDPDPLIEPFLHARFVQTHPTALAVAASQLLADEDRLVDLRERTVPLLVVTGETEDVWSADAMIMMAKQLGVGCTVIDGAGHSPAVDEPAATADALIAFWDEVERADA